MPRHKRRRMVCGLPRHRDFVPADTGFDRSRALVMGVDEYEALRLIDYLGLTQEECAGQMDVSRTTVQQIYNDARKKLSRLIVEGIPLTIEGGEYCLWEESGPVPGRGHRGRGFDPHGV